MKLVQFTKLQSTEMQSRLHLCVMHYTVLLTFNETASCSDNKQDKRNETNNGQINNAESIYFRDMLYLNKHLKYFFVLFQY